MNLKWKAWKKYLRRFQWAMAFSLVTFSIVRIVLHYLEPITSTLPDIIILEKSARNYRLIGSLLAVCGPFCLGLYAVLKKADNGDAFLPMQIPVLIALNMMPNLF